MTTRRATRVRVLLREDLARSATAYKVDVEQGIIFGVKMVGRSSPNTHGVQGVEGTDYEVQALTRALPLYEGSAANIDHPDRDRPAKDRSAYDRLGRWRQCRVVNGEVYGDLHLLKTHPMAERLLEAAVKMPDAFAASHNAQGDGEVRNRRYVIVEVVEVRSVDIVADGGTTKSLFESRENHDVKKVKLKLSIEQAKYDLSKRARLLEAMTGCGVKEDAEVPMDTEEPGYKDHCAALVGALLKDESMDPAERKKKVMQALKLADDEEPEATDTEESDEEDDEPQTKKKVEESRRKKPRAPAVRPLTAERCRSYCKLAGVEPTADLVESLAATGDETRALKLLEWAKGLQDKAAGGKPRSRQAGSHGTGTGNGQHEGTQTLESREPHQAPDKTEELTGWLRS